MGSATGAAELEKIMFVACDITYFEIGDAVIQNQFRDAPAKVIAAKYDSRVAGGYFYELEVDVRNHAEGFDENGERVATHCAICLASELKLA